MIYNPITCKDNLILGLAPNLVVVSGWTMPERLASLIPANHYSAIGSLYSRERGINFLLRNLIANPAISHVIALKLTSRDQNSKSVDFLESFFKYRYQIRENELGVKEAVVQLIDSKEQAITIDTEIPLIYLNSVLNYIQFQVFNDLDQAILAIKQIHQETALSKSLIQEKFQQNNKYPTSDLRKLGIKFPEKTIAWDQKPAPDNGIVVKPDNLFQGWLKLSDLILKFGKQSRSRKGLRILQLLNLVTSIDIEQHFATEQKVDFSKLAFSESYYQSYIASLLNSNQSNNNIEQSNKCNPNYVSYGYSDRIYKYFQTNQLEKVVNALRKNPHSTSVINLWDSKLDAESDIPPCLTNLGFKIENNQLHLTATFRSHDIFGAWYLNSSALLALHQKVLFSLNLTNLKSGYLTIISQAAHIYEYAFTEAEENVKRFLRKDKQKNRYQDPCGSFLVEITKDKQNQKVIQVLQEYQGKIVNKIKGNNVKKLYNEILENAPYLEREHCLYLGSELQKAAIAIALDIDYRQDKKLAINSAKFS